jgi:ribosomal-protein-alanine N-acetyltransferase
MADAPLGLETERLVLRQWRDSDTDAFAAMNADPEVMRHFPAPLSRAESDALLVRAQWKWREFGLCFFAVEVKGGDFIGFAGLNPPPFEAHFTPCVEVGWRLARHAWGKGYATEAARASLDYGFGVLGLPEIVSFTVPGNTRSRAVMTRIGMTHDPGDDFDHPDLPLDSGLRRHVLYRLGREE